MPNSSRLHAYPESHRPPQSDLTEQAGDGPGRQLSLAASIALAHRASGDRIRGLLRKAIEANRLSILDLAQECGVDDRQLGRCLRDDGGAHPPLSFIACLLSRDRLQVVLSGIADMAGFDLTPKRVDLEAEVRELRAALIQAREAIDRKLGGAQP